MIAIVSEDHDRRERPHRAGQLAPLGDAGVFEAAALRRLGAVRARRRRAPGLAAAPLRALRRALAEQALGPEDEDRDQDPEDDRAGPVAARRATGTALR